MIFGADLENEGEKKRRRAEEPTNDVDMDALFASGDFSWGDDDVGGDRRLSRGERGAEIGDSLSNAVRGLSNTDRNKIAVSIYQAEQTKLREAGRVYFTAPEKERVLNLIRAASQMPSLSWEGVQKRVVRVVEKGTFKRARGSGRKQRFTHEMREKSVQISRDADHELSRSEIYYTLQLDFGEALPSRPTCFRHFATLFKRRRIRLKPRLTEKHKEDRLNYAKSILANPGLEKARLWTDEKIFQGVSTGYLNIPHGDEPRIRAVQSKTNPVEVMVLVAALHPSLYAKCIVAEHYFVESEYAAKNSKNREAGEIVYMKKNVTVETYFEAYVQTVIPALEELISEGKINLVDVGGVLYLQDDNARPHRGLYRGKDVIQAIIDFARARGLPLARSEPVQPAQSPDTNPLDTFIFRSLWFFYRSLRARARVQAFRANIQLQEDVPEGELVEETGPEIHRTGFPMRCRPQGAALRGSGRVAKGAKCPACRKDVKDTDYTATECGLRKGWWHSRCVDELLDEPGYEHAMPMPDPEDEAAPWVCPQCMHFLCRNADAESILCVGCWEHSGRYEGEAGSDMIVCDGPGGGLFHKKCVKYNEEREGPSEVWRCAACELFGDEERWEETDIVSEGELGGNNLAAIRASVSQAVKKMQKKPSVFVRGFETRLAILEKIVKCNGGNDYNLHWRREK